MYGRNRRDGYGTVDERRNLPPRVGSRVVPNLCLHDSLISLKMKETSLDL